MKQNREWRRILSKIFTKTIIGIKEIKRAKMGRWNRKIGKNSTIYQNKFLSFKKIKYSNKTLRI